MTAATIRILAQAIPDDLVPKLSLGGRTSNNRDSFDPDTQRFLLQYRSLNFGWQYAMMAAQHPKRIPVIGSCLTDSDKVVFRAYLHLRFGYTYQDISAAKALLSPLMHTTRSLVEGLLVSSDATLANVSARSGVPLDAVLAYEKLFFNVLDRKTDISFMQHVVYPHGRLVEMVEGYLFNTPMADIIKRAGYTNGAQDVMYLMGAAPDAVAALEQAGDSKKLESLIMSMGLVMARNGGLHQPGLPGVGHARQLIMAGKLGGTQDDDSPLGTDAQSLLLREVKMFGRPLVMHDA